MNRVWEEGYVGETVGDVGASYKYKTNVAFLSQMVYIMNINDSSQDGGTIIF